MSAQTKGEGNTYKLIQLEAVRGIASVIVVFHHFSLAFLPGLKPAISGTPLAVFFNGEGAVTLFFLLSGFVLTRRYFDGRDRAISMAALKRLPRLFLPASISVLLGYTALSVLPHWYAHAANMNGSHWLADFGASGQAAGFRPSFGDAIARSFGVFIFAGGYEQYNSNLWTMHPELFGSLFCFAYAAFAIESKRAWSGAVLAMVALLVWRSPVPWLLPFALGVGVAQYFPFERIKIGLWPGLGLIAIGLALWISGRYALCNVGAGLIIMTLLICEPIAAALSGRTGLLLGRFSFPLYLVHAIVICTAASAVYVGLHSVLAAAAATALVSFVASLPFIYLEEWWVPFLNRLTRKGADRRGIP